MSANDTQVGGTHYKTGDLPQHWDLVVAYDWDYFQGQVTKYLMRWKTKHATPALRLQDLKKARHFLDKYIEVEEGKLLPEPASVSGSAIPLETFPSRMYPIAPKNEMLWEQQNPEQAKFWNNEGYYGDLTNLYQCRACKERFRGVQPPPEHAQPCQLAQPQHG